MRILKEVKCNCCKNLIKHPMGHQLYCVNCSLHHKEAFRKLCYYKRKAEELAIKLYGAKQGNMLSISKLLKEEK